MLIRPNLSPADNRRIQAMLYANNNGGNLRQMLRDGSAFYAPRTSSITQSRGSGTPTNTRATVAYVTNNDGYLVRVKSGEVREEGARRVENLATSNTDSVTVGEAIGVTNNRTGILPVVTANYADNPSGVHTASRLVLDIGAGTTNSDVARLYGNGGADVANSGTGWQFPIWLKSNTVDSYIVGVGPNNPIAAGNLMTVTPEWQRFTGIATNGAGYPQIALQGGNGTAKYADISMYGFQFSDTTGQLLPLLPREYVSVGVLSSPFHGAYVDGVKYFNTDISGNPIPSATLKGEVIEAAATNLLFPASDFSDASWSKYQATISSNSAVAPDGTTTADTLVADANTGQHAVRMSVTVANTTSHVLFFYAKAGTTEWIRVQAASMTLDAYFRLAGAGTVGTISGTGAAAIEALPNGWYICALVGATHATVGYNQIELAEGDGDVNSGASSGLTAYIWGADLKAGAYVTSHIPTTTAAVTRNKDVLDDQVSGNLTAAAGSVAFQWTPSHDPSGTIALGGSYVDASNYTVLLHDATNLFIRKRIAGVNYDAPIANTFVSGTA
ncbi:MAG: hypothetical protein NUV63_11130, partial [Gallionella sp.]|nr:hypothetical protein [Gallionella sp.]